MRSPAVLALALALGALHPAAARALACTPDPVPAATLLLPYFDLDVRDLGKPKPKRETTAISVLNLSPAATLARVTLWTDLSVPTLAFDLYLTGYDVEDVDLWEVFSGALPGDFAIPCNDGAETTRQLSAEQVETLRLAHQGKPVPANGGLCSAVDHGDTLLRGYVTVDASAGCLNNGAVFPTDPGYFGAGGIASNQNVLGGQYVVQSRKQKIVEPARLVAIEADAGRFGPGDATFYGRYVGHSGADAREPLPASWGLRYLNDPSAKQATELLVWRAAETVQPPFACDQLGVEGWYPMPQESIVWFDDFENAAESTAPAFPGETNRVAVGGPAVPIPDPRGWLFLDLRRDGGAHQSWVTARLRQGPPSARGLVDAVAFDASCGAAPPSDLPIPGPPSAPPP